MPGGQVSQERFLERGGALFLVLFLADTVIEVALTLDFGILQRIRPAAQLARAAFSDGFQI